MKKIIIIFNILVVIAASALLQSCTEGTVNPYLTDNEQGRSLIDSGFYPNTVGSYWKYELSDMYGNPYDTAAVVLLSKEILNNGSQILNYVYVDSYKSYQLSEELKTNDVQRYNPFTHMTCLETMKIPLSVGLKWQSTCSRWDLNLNESLVPYETVVESLDSIIINNYSFAAYKIVVNLIDSTYMPNGIPYAKETQYFVPYVGFIKGTYEEIWDPIGRQYYYIVNWILKDFKIEKR
jgi:hypothetical protein